LLLFALFALFYFDLLCCFICFLVHLFKEQQNLLAKRRTANA
jgi:hypothetical protein